MDAPLRIWTMCLKLKLVGKWTPASKESIGVGMNYAAQSNGRDWEWYELRRPKERKRLAVA